MSGVIGIVLCTGRGLISNGQECVYPCTRLSVCPVLPPAVLMPGFTVLQPSSAGVVSAQSGPIFAFLSPPPPKIILMTVPRVPIEPVFLSSHPEGSQAPCPSIGLC